MGVHGKAAAGGEYDAGVAIGEETEMAWGMGFIVQEEVVPDKTGQSYGRRDLHGMVKVTKPAGPSH